MWSTPGHGSSSDQREAHQAAISAAGLDTVVWQRPLSNRAAVSASAQATHATSLGSRTSTAPAVAQAPRNSEGTLKLFCSWPAS